MIHVHVEMEKNTSNVTENKNFPKILFTLLLIMSHTPHNEKSNFTTEDIQEANSTISEYIKFFRDFIVILFIVFFIRIFIITPFQINGQSMESSYHDKEFILVNKFSYLNFAEDPIDQLDNPVWEYLGAIWKKIPIHIGDPVRGDVVVIKPHVDKTREHYIKRVIGMPGDMIRFESGSVFLKTPNSSEFIQIHEPYLSLSNSGHTYLPDYIEANQFLIPE